MRDFTVGQFASACHAAPFGPPELTEKKIAGVVLDSRKVQKDFLFVATAGEHADGHSFIPDVFSRGAACVVSEKKLENPAGPYLLVENSLQALKDAAEAYRKTLDLPVIGITGSVGKTSTKEMIASILSQHYRVLKTPGNLNNEIGLPLTLFMIDREHQAAVLEMGMNHFGEMHWLSKMARPTVCVFTNIGVAHLEFLGSQDGILKAKTEMLDYAQENAPVFVNGDDRKLITLKNRPFTHTYGLSSENDIYAEAVENLGLEGIRCRIHTPAGSFQANIPLPGIHMVYNALAGTCVGLELGLTPEEIRAGIESLQPLDGRNHILHTRQYTILDDCYNANPVSMKAMLDVLNYAHTRKVAILGDMGELGKDAEEMHASVGEYLKNLKIDLVITIGTLSANIHQAGQKAAPNSSFYHFETPEEFMECRHELLAEGDSVLVKASHSMSFEQIVKSLAYSRS